MREWGRKRVSAAFVVALALMLSSFVACGGDEESDEPDGAPVAAVDAVSGDSPAGQRSLADLPKAEERATVEADRTDRIIGTENLSINQYLKYVVGDTADFWARQFAAGNLRFPTPYYLIVDQSNEPYDAGCGAVGFDSRGVSSGGSGDSQFIGPFYCPIRENVIYLPAGWLFDEAYGVEGREFGVGFVVAHEMAHHVQEVLGTLPAKRSGQVSSKQVELQADCLAGVWARTIGVRGLLESNDLEEAISLANQLGDPPGVPYEQEHGSSAERIDSFARGFESGLASNCPL